MTKNTSLGYLPEVVKVSSNDTTRGYLNGKLVAGAAIGLLENTDGGNETLSIYLDIHGTAAFTSIADDDEVLVYDASTELIRRMTRANFVAGLLSSMDITGLTAETTIAVGDELPFRDISASLNKKITYANLIAGLILKPGSTTENKVPQWDSTTGVLKDGLAVGTSALNLVQLNADGKLPAVDGSLLTGITGGSGAAVEWITRTIEGAVYETMLMPWVAPAACTIGLSGAYLTGNPGTSGRLYVQVMKNSTLETGSIFASDAPLQILDTDTATNGVYKQEKTGTSLDSGMITLAAGDVLHFRVNQADVGCADLILRTKVTYS